MGGTVLPGTNRVHFVTGTEAQYGWYCHGQISVTVNVLVKHCGAL